MKQNTTKIYQYDNQRDGQVESRAQGEWVGLDPPRELVKYKSRKSIPSFLSTRYFIDSDQQGNKGQAWWDDN